MAETMTLSELMQVMPLCLNREAALSLGRKYTVQFNFTGKDIQTFTATIEEGKCKVEHGPSEKPDLTMTISLQEYIDLITGKTNAQSKFLSGDLRITGDFSLAMKMQTLFSRTQKEETKNVSSRK